jgi:ABC-type nitrate/sulfonate/bicarbonate transport system substrate-binding protein
MRNKTLSALGARHYKFFILLIAMVLIGAELAVTSSAGAGAPLEKVTLRVGRIPQAQGMTPVTELMRRDKLIEAAGTELGLQITVDLQDFAAGPPIRQALTGDKLDIGSVGNTPTLIGIAQGEPFHVLSMAEGGVKFVLALPPNSPIKTPEDLKGKKVGILLATDLQFFFDLSLQALFGTMDYQTLGIEAVGIKALIQGAVPPQGLAAGTTTETSYLRGQIEKLNTGLFNSYGYTEANYDGPLGKGAGLELPAIKKSPYYPEGFYLHRNFWLVTNKAVRTSPKAVVAFLVAQQRALQALAKMPPEDVARLAQELWQLDPKVAKDIWLHDLDYRRGWCWLTEGDLRAVVDQSVLATNAKLIEKPVTWKEMLKNIGPVAPLAKQAWERVKFPDASAFTAKDAKDVRGYPIWESDKWELPKKQQ